MLPGWREVPVDIVKTVGETELQNFVKFKEEMVGVQVVDCENIWLLNRGLVCCLTNSEGSLNTSLRLWCSLRQPVQKNNLRRLIS